MYDADLDALAGEYVLGTLSADERSQAESLVAVDPKFVDLVHQWERRLGELNVMVEAVEPPPEVWDKIKSQVNVLALGEEVRPEPAEEAAPAAKSQANAEAEGHDNNEDAKLENVKGEDDENEQSPILTALASDLLPHEGEPTAKAEGKAKAKAEAASEPKLSPEFGVRAAAPQSAAESPHAAEVAALAGRVRRWRWTALFAGVLAALFAAVIAISQLAPQLIPAGRFSVPELFASAPTQAPSQRNNLIAVLQQNPTAPAFLLTLDAASRSLTVRRVAAKAEPGHAYQLWAILTPSAKPRSLGLVGASEFTRRPLPTGIDIAAIRTAQYEISFEPAGGSQIGAPTGPILFTGRMVESVPPSAPHSSPSSHEGTR